MKIEIFDVDHGQCALVTAPNGRRLLVDCGHKFRDNEGWWPSVHFLGEKIDLLALTNLDEDHLSNFPDLLNRASVDKVMWNPTINAAALVALKQQGMGVGVKAFHNWLQLPATFAPGRPDPDFSPVNIQHFYGPYIPNITTDTNNLSMGIIVTYGAFKIVFSGDMERGGWKNILANPQICAALAGTNVYIAAHHGRSSGCCDELFKIIKPSIVVMSDHEIIHDTQDTNAYYRQRCHGIPVMGTTETRYVYTTRNDGSLEIIVQPNGAWQISPKLVQTWSQTTA